MNVKCLKEGNASNNKKSGRLVKGKQIFYKKKVKMKVIGVKCLKWMKIYKSKKSENFRESREH